MAAADCRVLVLHNRPDDFRDLLSARFPDLEIDYATNAAEVPQALEALRPDVVFSIKQPTFPPPEHRPAVDFPTVRWF